MKSTATRVELFVLAAVVSVAACLLCLAFSLPAVGLLYLVGAFD